MLHALFAHSASGATAACSRALAVVGLPHFPQVTRVIGHAHLKQLVNPLRESLACSGCPRNLPRCMSISTNRSLIRVLAIHRDNASREGGGGGEQSQCYAKPRVSSKDPIKNVNTIGMTVMWLLELSRDWLPPRGQGVVDHGANRPACGECAGKGE